MNHQGICGNRLLLGIVNQQLPEVSLGIEGEFQLPIGDISSRAVESSCLRAAFVLAENKVGIGCPTDSHGAGNHIHGVLVLPFPQVMDQQDSQVIAVGQGFQCFQIPVVVGIGVDIPTCSPNPLEGVDYHQHRVWMPRKELLNLLLQPTAKLLRSCGEIEIARSGIGDVQQAALDAGVVIFQAEVEHVPTPGGKIPDLLPLRHLQTQPKSQPGLANLGRPCQ